MPLLNRPYEYPLDFYKVSDFLIRHFQPGNADANWLQPAWEYMHHHPMLDGNSLSRIRLWEAGGEIVAIAHYEWCLGEAFFQLHPEYGHLKTELLDYAEKHLSGTGEDGRCYLHAYINDSDLAFEAEAAHRGYRKEDQFNRPLYRLAIPDPFPPIELPDGFRLQSLADDNDLRKINRVLWRGFNHPGAPLEEELDGRKILQSGPNFRLDLTIVVEAPDGNFASYCGLWHERENRIAYVEPMATDPDYRRIGLGKAAVMEGLRRCKLEGATEAFVGSDLEFYQALGFKKTFVSNCWVKFFDP